VSDGARKSYGSVDALAGLDVEARRLFLGPASRFYFMEERRRFT